MAGVATRQFPHCLQSGQSARGGEVGSGGQLLLASDESIALSGAKIKLGPDSVAVVSGLK